MATILPNPVTGTVNGSSTKHEIVVPSDTVAQPQYRQIICTVAGNITIQLLNDSAAITYPLLQGQALSVIPLLITAATTATLLGLY